MKEQEVEVAQATLTDKSVNPENDLFAIFEMLDERIELSKLKKDLKKLHNHIGDN